MPLLLAYICYLLLGATIFQLLEKQAEAQSRDQFQLEKLRFLENYTCLDQQALEQFVQVREQGRMGQEEWGVGWVEGAGGRCRDEVWRKLQSLDLQVRYVTLIRLPNLCVLISEGERR